MRRGETPAGEGAKPRQAAKQARAIMVVDARIFSEAPRK
jgi:hypothetical protein